MNRFVDLYLDEQIPSWPVVSEPRFSTRIAISSSGAENVRQVWQHPLYRFSLPEVIREQHTFEAARTHWLIMRGPLHTWPFRDPLDFASAPLQNPNFIPQISDDDQHIGVGDGARTKFQLKKTYETGVYSYVRNIRLPVISSVVVSVNGVSVSNFTVDRYTGEITFDQPVAVGDEIRAGFLFDVEVRFESDDTFSGIVQNYAISGIADLTFIEVRPC